jgi:N,N'-diacetyllegionaminate synthase
MNFNQNIKLGKRTISKESQCLIIAEAGVNHNGNINTAKKLIDIAVESGVDVVKFQTWITEELLTEKVKQAEYQKENTGKEESQYQMIKKLELKYEDFEELKRYCEKKNIIFMSTPDEEKSMEFLYNLKVPGYKVGSGELNNLDFLKK